MQHLEPVQIRQAHVQNDQVGRRFRRQRQSAAPIRGALRVPPVVVERADQRRGQIRLVVDHHNTRREAVRPQELRTGAAGYNGHNLPPF